MMRFHLYCPFYTPKEPRRLKEILFSLNRNINVKYFEKIFLLIDDLTPNPIQNCSKIEVINLSSRPTYADWLKLSVQRSQGVVTILSNSDIYFDNTLSRIEDIFNSSGLYSFVALSRYELVEGQARIHSNPKWSQDSWAFYNVGTINTNLINAASFQLGVPRCDNKIAAVFSEHGYKIFNPCHQVKSYHVHESGLRNYQSESDLRILGSTMWVEPSKTLTTPSKLHLDYWTLNSCQIENYKINNTFSQIAQSNTLSADEVEQNLIVAHDANWQYPAITEKHAYRCLLQAFKHDSFNGSIKYVAFPWATFIDLKKNKNNSDLTKELSKKLEVLKNQIKHASCKITVCQHIRMLEFEDIFSHVGITDVFWSHAVKGQECFPCHKHIKIYPFPLFPVQAPFRDIVNISIKKYLFSFVGAKSAPFYLTESRNHIINHLSQFPNCYVKGRDQWHYNKVVYDHQIRGSSLDSVDIVQPELISKQNSFDFLESLRQSTFSLCPSGSGPNSIRLWESIGLGAIPVILADTLKLPGDQKLWNDACVFCKETESDIKELPKLLEQLRTNDELLLSKKNLLRQIWFLYGFEGFVTDIKNFILEKKNHSYAVEVKSEFIPCKFSPINGILDNSDQSTPIPDELPSAKEFIDLLHLNTFIMLDPNTAFYFIKSNYTFVSRLYQRASASSQRVFVKLNSLYKLETSFWKNAQN